VATSFGERIPSFARTRKVIAPEQMGHGHTGDGDRPLSYQQMADDTAALLEQLGVARADVYGRSDGGVVALYLAARHRGACASSSSRERPSTTGIPLGWRLGRGSDAGELARGRPPQEDLPGQPRALADLPAEGAHMDKTGRGCRRRRLLAIKAPAMIVIGDRDMVSLEQAGRMLKALPRSRLCVLPTPITRSCTGGGRGSTP
jgi:pimeloyl-ACP methyl ester carboxylesterase